jgi:lysophospholipase L1-like esterase
MVLRNGESDLWAINSYVALGDSFTIGIGDPDVRCPSGWRGWPERVAEQLSRRAPGFRHANLAVRGHRIAQVEEWQIPQAVAMQPDLVTIYAGYADLVRPRVDFDDIARRYDAMIARLVDAHIAVLIWTAPDVGWAPVHRLLRGRAAIYSEIVREIADRRGAEVLDFWRLTEFKDSRMWDRDRMHLAPGGHRRMAAAVLDTLEVNHTLGDRELPPSRQTPPLWAHVETLTWVGEHLTPWLGRRLLGGPLGHPAASKRPQLQRLA